MTIIALDIETIERPMPHPMFLEAKTKIEKKNAEAYKKLETIEAHNKEDLAKFVERWKFSRRGAQVLCVGFGVLNGESPGFSVGNCYPHEDERVVLQHFVEMLGDLTVTKIVTANGWKFDLPILFAAMARHEVVFSSKLRKYDFIDLFREPFEQYSGVTESLDGLCEIYGVDWPADRFPTPGFESPDGSQVAAMWEADKADEGSRIKNYCLSDVWCTAEIFNRISRFVQL